MENKGLVSVVVPVYNGEKYIKETLCNILSSDYQNIEVICIDDCSKDNSREILREIAKEDSRIKLVFNEENLTMNKNVKKGISLCSGEYICLCGQDDLYAKDKISKEVEYLKQTGKDGVYAKVATFYDKTGLNKIFDTDASSFVELLKKDKKTIMKAIYCVEEGMYLPMAQSALWKAQVLKELNIWRQKVDLDDWPILVKSFENYNMGFINEVVAFWRQHDNANHNNFWWNCAISLSSALQVVPDEYKYKILSRNCFFAISYALGDKDFERAFKFWGASLVFDFHWKNFLYGRKIIKSYLKTKRRQIKQFLKLKVKHLCEKK